MNYARLASRVAVGGVGVALATAGLVGVTSTAANATNATTNYTCAVPVLGNQPFTVTVNATLPPTANAGTPIPANFLTFPSTVTIPPAVVAALGTNANGAKSDDFSTAFGPNAVKTPVVWNKPPATPPGPGESATYSGTGSNAAFALPAAGTYTVSMPTTFTLIPTKDGAALPFTATCTAAGTPGSVGSITLAKQVSETKAKGPKSVQKGAVVTLKVTVKDVPKVDGVPVPSGKLIVKDGKKKVGSGKLDKKGKAKIKVKGLKPGAHKLTVQYKGDGYTAKSKSKALKLTVKG